MKTTDSFKRTIEEHLKFRAFTDPLFAVTLKKDGKNIDDCLTYILNTVKSSKIQGFEDKEIFKMAVHYYDEDKIKVGTKVNRGDVVVNHQVVLTEEEIADAKQKAIDDLISDEKARMRKKPKQVTVVKDDKAKEEGATGTLF